MTSPDMGTASGKVQIVYESTGAAKVTQELENVKRTAQNSASGFNSASQAFTSFGNTARQASGVVSGQIQGLVTTFGTLGRTGTGVLGAVTQGFSMLGRTGGQAMRDLMGAIKGGGPGVAGAAGGVGKLAGVALSGAMKLAMTAGIATIVAAVAAIGTVLGAGLKRLVSLDEARHKLEALGYSGEQTKGIMEDVKEAALGTAYSLDEMATGAAQALAAGVPEGEGLTTYLKGVASAAAIANKDFNEMALIFNKIQATGKLTSRTLMQMEQAGMAPVAMLSKQLGKSQAQVRDMITKGQVSAKLWQETVTQQMGNAADIMGKSISGSIRNMKAAIGRMGENILAPLFAGSQEQVAPIPALINKVSKAIDSMGKSIGAWVAANKDDIKRIWDILKGFAQFVITVIGGRVKVIWAALTTIWKAAWEAAKPIFEGLTAITRKWSADGQSAMQTYKDATDKLASVIRSWGPMIAKVFATVAAMVLNNVSVILKALSMWMEFVGHVGPVVVNFAKVCVDSFKAIAKGAGKLGGILEKVPDPVLRMAGKGLKGIEKGWEGVDNALEGAAKGIDAIHQAAPKTGEMSRDLSQLSKELLAIDFHQVFAKGSADKLAAAQRRGGAAADAAAEDYLNLQKILEELGLSMEDLQEGVQGSEKDFDKLLKTLEKKGAPPKLVQFVKDMRKEFKETDKSATAIADSIAKIGDQSEDASNKVNELTKVLRDLGEIPGELDEAWDKFNETLEKVVDYSDDWVDILWSVGPALIKQNGLLNTQNKNGKEAANRMKSVSADMREVIAKGGDVEEAYARAEAHVREILSRIGIGGPEAGALVEKYLGTKPTLELVTSVKDGDKTKATLASIIAQAEKAQREGKTDLDLSINVPPEKIEEFKAVAEQYGLVWKDYNEVTGYVKLEIPSVEEFTRQRAEMQRAISAQGPLKTPQKYWWTPEEMAKSKKDAEEKSKKDPVTVEGKVEFQPWEEAKGDFMGGGGSFDLPPAKVEADIVPPEEEKREKITDKAKGDIETFVEQVPELLKPGTDKAMQAGQSFSEAFAAGILSRVQSVQEAALAVAEVAAGALPGSPAKYGPLSGEGFTGTRGKKFTSAFAQGIKANVGQVRSSAVSVAYGAAKPMTDRFDQFIKDLGELSSFGRKVADFMSGLVDIGLNIGRTVLTIGEQFGLIPKAYQAAGKEMTLAQAQRLQRQQALAGQPQVEITGGRPGKGGAAPQVTVNANAGNVEVSTAGTTVPLVQNPDGTWTSPDPEWAKLIKRESGGRARVLQEIEDINKGANKAQGLFQITPETWRGAGGERFAAVPNMATPQQQAAIAAQIFGQRGGQPWGSGAGQNFGRENEAALRAGLVKPLVQAGGQAGGSLVRVAQQANSSATALKGASVTYNKAWTEAQGLTPLYTPGEYAYGAGGMPQWATDMAKQFGLQVSSSISASGATSLHGAGFAFDFSGSTENMERMAKWLRDTEEIRSNTMQLIFQGAGGARYGVAGGQALQGAEYYGAGTYGQHADHIHWATTVAPILANANSQALGMPDAITSLPSQFAGTGAAPGPQRRPGPVPAPGPRPGPLDDAAQGIIDLGDAAKTATPGIKGLGTSAASSAAMVGDVSVDLTKSAAEFAVNAPEAGLKPAALAAQRAIAQIFGPQGVREIGGYRANDPFPFHPGGRAIDVMIDNWQAGGKALGDRINQWAIANAEAIGLEGAIWRQQYYGVENAFKASAMADRGDATQNHMDHVHLQFKVGAVGLDTAGALSLAGVPVNQLPQEDSRNLASASSSLLGVPDLVRQQAEQDPMLAEAISVARSGNAIQTSQAIPLLQHMDGLIAAGNADQTEYGKASVSFLSQVRDGIMTRAAVEEAPQGGMLDQVGAIAGGVSTIIQDFFDIFDGVLKSIAAAKDIGDTLVRGIANTEDIMRMVDSFQTFLELAQKIAQTVSDVTAFAGQMAGAAESAAGMGGGAAAALQAVSAISGIIAGVIGMINQGIELAQEAYRIGTKYMGRMLQAWLGLPGANDVAYLLDTLTGQLQAYTTENPELKQTFNTLGRQLGLQYQERIGAQNQFNIYQGPGQDPRDTMNDAMFSIRSSGVGAFGYAGT